MHALLLVRARVCFPGTQLSGLWAVKTTGGPLVRTDRLCSQNAEVASPLGAIDWLSQLSADSTGKLSRQRSVAWLTWSGSSLATIQPDESRFFTCFSNIFVCVPAEWGPSDQNILDKSRRDVFVLLLILAKRESVWRRPLLRVNGAPLHHRHPLCWGIVANLPKCWTLPWSRWFSGLLLSQEMLDAVVWWKISYTWKLSCSSADLWWMLSLIWAQWVLALI